MIGAHFVRIDHGRYGQAVEGGGLAVLYVSICGAFLVYNLITWPAACALMLATTAVAAWLADLQRSQALAMVSVGGGFATPFLLDVNPIPQVPLFTYEAMLVGATMSLAHRRTWPSLFIVSYASVVLTLAAWAARSYTPDKFLITEIYLALFCAMFLVIGNFMGKVRPNWFVGVRTPWTLSSKMSWNKTHRLARWLFVVMGLSIAAAGILQSTWMFILMLAVNGLCIAWMIVYSYLVYRRDPDRTSPADVSPGAE
jgi:uncharacterized membrane protein